MTFGPDRELHTITLRELEDHLSHWYAAVAPSTWNRHASAIDSFFNEQVRLGELPISPALGLTRLKVTQTTEQLRRAQVFSDQELEALWQRRGVPLRDRLLWRMLYDTAARANEILGLDVPDVDPARRRAAVTGKGQSKELVFWTSATARLLPRYLGDRTDGPLFLSTRRTPEDRTVAASDIDRLSGLPRLSYRQAADKFKRTTGKTLHKLRHTALTRLAEQGVPQQLLQAKSRHKSSRSLDRYISPSADAVAAVTDLMDPNRRRP